MRPSNHEVVPPRRVFRHAGMDVMDLFRYRVRFGTQGETLCLLLSLLATIPRDMSLVGSDYQGGSHPPPPVSLLTAFNS